MADDSPKQDEGLDPRTYFAAERTLLAWIRTGVALMGFGFVVARFGLFLRELATVSHAVPAKRTTFSLWVGTTLVIFGVSVILGSALKHYARVRGLEQGQPVRFRAWSMEMVVAFLLALLGLLMAGYLVVGLDSH